MENVFWIFVSYYLGILIDKVEENEINKKINFKILNRKGIEI